MSKILPSTAFGGLVRWISKGRVCRFSEEKPGFQLPPNLVMVVSSDTPTSAHCNNQERLSNAEHSHFKSTFQSGSTILASWYDARDEDNPHFWPLWIKIMVYIQINFYTFIVYMASSIFSVAEPDFIDIYGVSTTVASLGLALVLLGYGIGALLFSPLSEIPAVGRNLPYVISLAFFLLVSGIAVAVNNVPGFLALRFLQGFFGSPCLATGAASLADITDLVNLPFCLWIWGICAVAAPAVAPCIAGFSIMANGWKWSMWEILWGAAPCLVIMVCCLTTAIVLE
jgi:DHA1 family multidrug resistance protein-like MFS transporter